MKKSSFKEELFTARQNRYAIGAFNIFNYVSASAAIKAAEQLNTPIILQTSTKTVKQYGAEALGDILKLLAKNQR